MHKSKGTARPPRPKPPKKAAARRGAPQEGGPLAVGQRVRVVRDGKVCDGDVSFLSPLRDTCTITYVDKTVETFVSVKRLRSASRDGGFAVLAAPPTDAAPKSLLRFKRGDRVEVRRGKTWAKRTVRSCEATGPGTADLTLADPWGNEEFHQLDESEGLDDVIRWEKRPRGASLDTPPAPAPKAKAPQPKSPPPKAAAVKQLHDVVARQASAERERVETTGPAWARRGATCQVDCGHDWFDCTLTTKEKQGTWRIRHADGAFENGVALERLRERQWFAAGSLARVAYQDRWHDCKILAVSRDRKTCTVRYEDNGYAEENVPVATRLRELRYADPVAPVPLPDFSKPAPKPVSLASSSDRDSPAVVESKNKKKKVPPPPPRFVERAPAAPKPKAKPLRAKPDIDLTGDDDESPRKAPKPKQKPAAPHPPSKPKPAKAVKAPAAAAPKPKPASKAAKAPPTVAAAKEKAQPKPKPVPKALSAPKADKAKPEAAAAPKAPKAPRAATEKAAPKPKLVRKVTVEAAKEKAAPKPKPAPKAPAATKAPKAKPAPKAKKPEVAAPPAPKPSPTKKAAPEAPKARPAPSPEPNAAKPAAPKSQKKAAAPTRESPKKAKAFAPKRPSPEKAEAPPKPDAAAAPRQPKRPSFFPKADAAAPAPQPSPKKAAARKEQEASPKPAAASPKPKKPQTPPKPTPAGPQNTPAGPQTTPAARPTPAAPATLTPNQSRSHEQALETLKLAANPDLEPLPPRRRPSAPKSPSPEKAAPPTPVAPKEPEASPKPAAAPTPPPAPEPEAAPQSAEERPPTPPPPAKEATAASPKRERRLGPGTTLTPRRKSSIDEPVGRGALGRKVQKFETGPPPATPAPQPTSPSSTTPVLLHYKSGADVTSNEMDLTDKWLGKPVAALKAAFAKRMSLDVDGLSTKRADGTAISEALPIRDIIDGVEGSANVVFELKASE